ncbi:hypothetical protein [Chitinivorax sp. B]|uniref:hypothetical protein n=1 Tax=Chitinivorax sp. B TaxID=2502235 RepID=UPI0010F73AA6|nr:hypothetical protein [Chitinivorax sp. B]
MDWNRAVSWGMVASLLLLSVALWQREALPAPSSIRDVLHQAPTQTVKRAPAFETHVKGVRYQVQPRYDYELHGLVVSRHDAAVWWDYAHKAWNDNLNVVDLCVVWGDNVKQGLYRELDYSNDQWTCWVKTDSNEVWDAFDQAAMSNNHLITDNPRIAKQLQSARIGDQIHIRGYLADYATFKDGRQIGTRVSSEVRTDTGNGACEVLYVESFHTLRAGNVGWRRLVWVAAFVLLACIAAWLWLPATFRD